MKNLKKILPVLLALIVIAVGGVLFAQADYDDGMDCPACGKYHWDDWIECEDCGMCINCAADYSCPYCDECTYCAGDCCDGCGACPDCAEIICSECGEHCFQCADDSQFCVTCERCGECNGETACPGCRECCGECDERVQCGDCLFCEDCAMMICTECGDKCRNCADESEFCSGCGRCGECNGETACPGCGETCGECDTKEQCGDCLYCEDCGEMICTECGNKCFNCSDDSEFCIGCGRCGECNGETTCPGCRETCGECDAKEQCGDCLYCEDCGEMICTECGNKCFNCSDDSEFCIGCGRCGECNSGSACPGCSETCCECEDKLQCGECFYCEDCVDYICEGCETSCTNCVDEAEFCKNCGSCPDCNDGTTCPGCSETCMECNNVQQCRECFTCDDCISLCNECGDICYDCDEGWCYGCNACSDCNGETACPNCHDTCQSCSSEAQCNECYTCENCVLMCSNCGEICMECAADGWCFGCDTCADCNGDTACPGCGESCLECETISQCKSCFHCADCAAVCESCGDVCEDCADSFCSNCKTCGDCNGDTVCPDCGNTCLDCGNIDQCRDCYVCADCGEICSSCGEICRDCGSGWCDHCNSCGDCNGDTACPSCGMTCELCGQFDQCRGCRSCEECADICVNCGDACSECDSGFNKTLGLCHTCDVHDVQVSVVINRINAIVTVEYTPECKAKIDAATAAYNSLTDDQKSLVSNYNDLRNAGRVYARLKAADDQRKANMAISGINNIGNVTYSSESYKKIAIAKKFYALLTADQKALVTNYDVLEAAEAKYKELKDAANAAAADKSASDSVISKINAIGTVSYADSSKLKIDIARKAYNELTAGQKALVTNYNTLTAAEAKYNELKAAAEKATADKAAADAVIAKIKAIGTVEYTSACKAKIDDARSAYNALTADGKKLVTNYSVLTAAETEYANLKAKAASEAAVNAVTAKIKAIGNVEYTSACKTKIDDARSAYNTLTADQKKQVFNYNILTDAEAKYAKLKADADKAAADKAAANAATAKISAVGTVEYTSASKAKIDAARAAYNALTAEQKTMVTNYAVLKAAEAKYAELKAAAEKSAADKTAADAVTAKIAAIGKVEYTVASKTNINSARIAYNALSADQKPLVTNYGTLTAAEAKYNELKAAAEDPGTPKIVKGVSLGGDVKLDCKKTATLEPTIDADPGAKYTVKYESSNPKVATVDQDGNVFAAKKGTAIITVTVTDSNNNVVTDTCKVTVNYTFIQWILVIVLFGWIWF